MDNQLQQTKPQPISGAGTNPSSARRKPETYLPKFEPLPETASRLIDLIGRRTGKPEYRTGMEVVDKGLYGLSSSRMVVIAARPGCGKTSFACQIALNLAEDGHKVAFLSLEMTKESILERMFCAKMGVRSHDLLCGSVSASIQKKLALYAQLCAHLNLRIIDDYCHTENELFTLIEHLEFRPQVIFLDHIQHIRALERRSQWECLTEYLRYLKELAMKYKISMVVLSQINRAGEDAPTLANLKGTGAIEEMADAVLLMHRPEEPAADGSNISIEVAKNRFGPTGPFGVYFDGETFKFYNSNQEAMRDLISSGRVQ